MLHGLSLFPKRFQSLAKYLGLFGLCFLLAVGCNGKQQTSAPSPSTSASSGAGSDRVTVGMTVKPRTLDPADSYEIAGLNLIYNLGDTLYTYEPGTTNLKPQLAKEMPKISADGLTYTIPLRENVTFQDGTPFNAEAMAFSLKRFIENGGKPSFLLKDVVEEVKATGANELSVKLKQPFSAFTAVLAYAGTCAVSPKAYELGSGKFSPSQFVGTGPYKLAEFSSDSIRLTPYENYWGEKPKNGGIDLQIYGDNSANLFNAFRTGAIDIAYQSIEPEQLKSLSDGAEKGQWQAVEASGTAVNFLALNRKQAPLDKLEVRQAIAALIDRNLIRDRVFQGEAEPLYSLIPTTFDVSQPSFEKAYGNANIAKANELLAKAGYSAQNPAVVQLWYPSSSTPRSLVAATLKAYAEKELGGALKFEPQAVEGATFFKNVADGIYAATLSNWYPDFLDPDNYINPLVACSKGTETEGCTEGGAKSQGSSYWNKDVNEEIQQQRKEKDAAKRKEIFAKIQEQIAADVPYIPLWQNKEYIFVKNGVEGVKLNPAQSIPFASIKK
ncbi:ABC transporter substrate-binding protein [Oscillatoria sp. FACHB-1406]|uniref:ABC transporter substrate-binding protein n=1 Tax=Oscillatoria sp. FACHB-1406 TaxID=2692846 RepID=UPI001684CE97|nr:ABC transporter substrate-binding protein [Oscillatoria sp. FACHB-1406]MBD2580325.1 peptide ABC transporter substrate-binding protein [Oscillatoria sp. FACHB-1406]